MTHISECVVLFKLNTDTDKLEQVSNFMPMGEMIHFYALYTSMLNEFEILTIMREVNHNELHGSNVPKL